MVKPVLLRRVREKSAVRYSLSTAAPSLKAVRSPALSPVFSFLTLETDFFKKNHANN
jgi:hypothetical protein